MVVDEMSWDAFFDDAAIFPPGNEPLDVAVATHLAKRGTPDGQLIGTFVCPASRIEELCDTIDHGHLDLSLVANTDHTSDVVAALASQQNLTLTAVELPIGVEPMPAGGATLVVERRWDGDWDVPEGAVLKLRCGGEHPSDVPDLETLASAIHHCVSTSTPLKLTAGLHQAVRGVDSHTGFIHHGFLNVAVAMQRAMAGQDAVGGLALVDGHDLAEEFAAGVGVRELFRSIGTCDTTTPVHDLRSLQLIQDRKTA